MTNSNLTEGFGQKAKKQEDLGNSMEAFDTKIDLQTFLRDLAHELSEQGMSFNVHSIDSLDRDSIITDRSFSKPMNGIVQTSPKGESDVKIVSLGFVVTSVIDDKKLNRVLLLCFDVTNLNKNISYNLYTYTEGEGLTHCDGSFTIKGLKHEPARTMQTLNGPVKLNSDLTPCRSNISKIADIAVELSKRSEEIQPRFKTWIETINRENHSSEPLCNIVFGDGAINEGFGARVKSSSTDLDKSAAIDDLSGVKQEVEWKEAFRKLYEYAKSLGYIDLDESAKGELHPMRVGFQKGARVTYGSSIDEKIEKCDTIVFEMPKSYKAYKAKNKDRWSRHFGEVVEKTKYQWLELQVRKHVVKSNAPKWSVIMGVNWNLGVWTEEKGSTYEVFYDGPALSNSLIRGTDPIDHFMYNFAYLSTNGFLRDIKEIVKFMWDNQESIYKQFSKTWLGMSKLETFMVNVFPKWCKTAEWKYRFNDCRGFELQEGFGAKIKEKEADVSDAAGEMFGLHEVVRKALRATMEHSKMNFDMTENPYVKGLQQLLNMLARKKLSMLNSLTIEAKTLGKKEVFDITMKDWKYSQRLVSEVNKAKSFNLVAYYFRSANSMKYGVNPDSYIVIEDFKDAEGGLIIKKKTSKAGGTSLFVGKLSEDEAVKLFADTIEYICDLDWVNERWPGTREKVYSGLKAIASKDFSLWISESFAGNVKNGQSVRDGAVDVFTKWSKLKALYDAYCKRGKEWGAIHNLKNLLFWLESRKNTYTTEIGNVRVHDMILDTYNEDGEKRRGFHVCDQTMRHIETEETKAFYDKIDEIKAEYKAEKEAGNEFTKHDWRIVFMFPSYGKTKGVIIEDGLLFEVYDERREGNWNACKRLLMKWYEYVVALPEDQFGGQVLDDYIEIRYQKEVEGLVESFGQVVKSDTDAIGSPELSMVDFGTDGKRIREKLKRLRDEKIQKFLRQKVSGKLMFSNGALLDTLMQDLTKSFDWTVRVKRGSMLGDGVQRGSFSDGFSDSLAEIEKEGKGEVWYACIEPQFSKMPSEDSYRPGFAYCRVKSSDMTFKDAVVLGYDIWMKLVCNIDDQETIQKLESAMKG